MELALDDETLLDYDPDLANVSILVFVELALDAWPMTNQKSHLAGFQSLFSWNLLLMSASILDTDEKHALTL